MMAAHPRRLAALRRVRQFIFLISKRKRRQLLQVIISSFAVAAPRAWNKLLSPLRRVYSVNIFKRQLKTFIFAQAF